jgi:MoaA/NifB/PqqE/SkfB family radical SAM enzyme
MPLESRFKKITACLDMAGCPNRCRHCWLGASPNGHLKLPDLTYVAGVFRPFAQKFEVASWYREPDYLDNYKELYEAECCLSAVHTPHYELMSFWRAVRDPEYVPWLRSLDVKASQLTLFGGEKATDFHYRRKGAFAEIMKSIDLLLENGIAPRIQIFIHQKNMGEMPFLGGLVEALCPRVKDIGQELAAFVHQGSCEGENEELYDIRVTPEQVREIPPILATSTLKHFQKPDLFGVFGQPEQGLCQALADDPSTQSFVTDTPIFFIDKDFFVYPNTTEPTRWWRLGNLKTDGCKAILNNYQNGTSVAQRIAGTVPVCEMAKACGDMKSQRLFTRGDYLAYLLNRYCRKHGEEFL